MLYVRDTLLSSLQGQPIMADTLSWILDAALRPTAARFDSLAIVDSTHVAFHFSAAANLDYLLQARSNLGTGGWSTTQDLSSAATNRFIWVTNAVSGTQSKFYRLVAGP